MKSNILTVEDLEKLQIAQYECKRSLLYSTRYLFKKIYNRKYIVRRHHEIMAAALERVFRGEITRLIITIPPRYGKTELGVINTIAHGLALNPSAKFMHLSASASLALENSDKARELVKSEAYQQLFPEVRVKADTDSKAKWYTEAGGGVYAAGAAGQLQGFGAGQTEDDENDETEKYLDLLLSEIEAKEGFTGAIIVDDSVKADDADSDVKREKVNRRWSGSIKSRLNSRKTPIIIIQQRLHELDLVGYVLATEPEEWTVVNIPALYVDENGQLQCLDPTKHTVADLVAMENHRDEEVRIFFQRQMQQNPKSREGLLFAETDLHYYDPETVRLQPEFSFGYGDPADEGGDDLSFPFGWLVGQSVYVHDVIYNKHGTDVNMPEAVAKIREYKCNAVQIEGNSAWILFVKGVRNKVEESGYDCEIRSIKNTTNKHVRILAMSAIIRNHFVFRKDWQTAGEDYRRFMECLTSYRRVQTGASKNAHDDAPDSMAGMAKYFSEQFGLW